MLVLLCVNHMIIYVFLLILVVVLQVGGMSYHAASGIIALGHLCGVDVWQTAPYIAPTIASQGDQPTHVTVSKQATFSFALSAPLPAHPCVRERMAEAQEQVDEIEAFIGKSVGGLRQQSSSGQSDLKLKRIPKGAVTHPRVCILTMFRGER